MRPGLNEYDDRDRLEYGYAPWAYNKELEEKLWEKSLELVGLPADFDQA